MTKWNGIDRNKKPRQISLKKLTKLEQEKTGEIPRISYLSKIQPSKRQNEYNEYSEPHIKLSWLSNNGLSRNKKPRQISKKKLAKLPEEKHERVKVKIRANGKCEVCELKPCAPTYQISCHERVYKSAGGKVSELNSSGVCDLCHDFLQHYRLHDKKQCVRAIMIVRHVNEYVACAIYDKICQFANKHGLLRESKLKG